MSLMNQGYEGVYLPTSDPNTYESTPTANAGSLWNDEAWVGRSTQPLFLDSA